MKMLVGLLKPAEGDVKLNGSSIRKAKPERLSRQISMVYQNPEDMFIKDSIYHDVAYAMEVRGMENAAERTEELLRRFRLLEYRDRDGRLLSGGQMRRASLAIGVALNPGILLLDEPTANLDMATRKEIMKTLSDMKEITETVMIATHDMQLVCDWAERIIVLCQGRVIADGSRDEIFGNRAVMEIVGIRPPEIFSMGRRLDPEALCYTVKSLPADLQEGAVMKATKKLSENILDKFSIDFLRNQVLKNAYGNDDTVIAGLDARILIVWYLFFGLVPWFVNDLPFLIGCFLLVALTTKLARVAGLVLLLFLVGVFYPDRLSADRNASVRRRCFGCRAASGADAEGGHGFPGVYYDLFRPGPG